MYEKISVWGIKGDKNAVTAAMNTSRFPKPIVLESKTISFTSQNLLFWRLKPIVLQHRGCQPVTRPLPHGSVAVAEWGFKKT